LGGTRAGEAGAEFKWDDGTPMTDTNWAQGEPKPQAYTSGDKFFFLDEDLTKGSTEIAVDLNGADEPQPGDTLLIEAGYDRQEAVVVAGFGNSTTTTTTPTTTTTTPYPAQGNSTTTTTTTTEQQQLIQVRSHVFADAAGQNSDGRTRKVIFVKLEGPLLYDHQRYAYVNSIEYEADYLCVVRDFSSPDFGKWYVCPKGEEPLSLICCACSGNSLQMPVR
jgi:hypothetical protein